MAKRQYQSGPFLNGSRRTLMCSGLHAVTVCNCIPMQMLFRTCPSHVRLLTCWRCSNHWPSRRSQVIHDYIHDMLVILSESHGCAPSRPRWLIPCTPFSCPLKPRAYPGLVTQKKKRAEMLHQAVASTLGLRFTICLTTVAFCLHCQRLR